MRRAVVAAALAVLAACSSPPRAEIDVAPVPLRLDTALAVQGVAEDALDVRLTVLVEPVAPWSSLTLLGTRPEGEDGDDARMLVRLSVTEFPGQGPVSFGRSTSVVVAFGDDPLPAAPERPILRTFPLTIETQAGVLARQVEVAATLHPVDAIVERTEVVTVERDDGSEVLEPRVVRRRNAGAPVALPRVRRVLCAVPPPVAPVGALLDGDATPAEVFLASARTLDDFWSAAGGPAADDAKRAVFDAVEALIAALDDVEPDRIDERSEAIFASLLLLTDASAGRDVIRWRRWWDAQDTNLLR